MKTKSASENWIWGTLGLHLGFETVWDVSWALLGTSWPFGGTQNRFFFSNMDPNRAPRNLPEQFWIDFLTFLKILEKLGKGFGRIWVLFSELRAHF